MLTKGSMAALEQEALYLFVYGWVGPGLGLLIEATRTLGFIS